MADWKKLHLLSEKGGTIEGSHLFHLGAFFVNILQVEKQLE